MEIAQCLYVLTDENYPIIEEVRSNAEYTACLLAVVRSTDSPVNSNGKGKESSDARVPAFRVLCCGAYLRRLECLLSPRYACRYTQEHLTHTAPIHRRNVRP